MAEGKLKGSINTMKEWFANLRQGRESRPRTPTSPWPNAHVQLEKYREAIPAVISHQALRGQGPESWYLLKMAAHYELKQYKPATEVLTALADRIPGEEEVLTQLGHAHAGGQRMPGVLAALGSTTRCMPTEAKRVAAFANYLSLRRVLPPRRLGGWRRP